MNSFYKSATKTKAKTAPARKDWFSCTHHDKHCLGCMYYCESTCSCDYILITHRARQLICGPGKDCTVKRKGNHPQMKGYDGLDIIYEGE